MIVEIRDMPNQNIKSVDIHIDFQNSENNHTSVNFSKKNEKSVDVSEKILENGHQVKIEDITEEDIKSTEIPKEMLDASIKVLRVKKSLNCILHRQKILIKYRLISAMEKVALQASRIKLINRISLAEKKKQKKHLKTLGTVLKRITMTNKVR